MIFLLLIAKLCDFPIINSQIVEKHGIKVKPFIRQVNFIEASGNSLNLLGSESSEWVHQMFPVPKPGRPEVRLVADFKRLNSALQRPTYPVESNSRLLCHLHPSSQYFCTLDMTSGYHQIAVHEEDRHLLTVISTQGHFRYNSLSQGIWSASDFSTSYQMGT